MNRRFKRRYVRELIMQRQEKKPHPAKGGKDGEEIRFAFGVKPFYRSKGENYKLGEKGRSR